MSDLLGLKVWGYKILACVVEKFKKKKYRRPTMIHWSLKWLWSLIPQKNHMSSCLCRNLVGLSVSVLL